MKHDKKKDNVILFPGLKERLIEKGMTALKDKQYQEALHLFSEAKSFDEDEESDIHLGMAICFLELGELQEAKRVCEKMLNEGYGHYFTVLQVYMTILIQLKEYEEVKQTIEAVLEENHLPPESAEHFYKLLEFSRKMIESPEEIVEDFEGENNEWNAEEILTKTDQQVHFIHSLKDRNITPHIGLLNTILQKPNANPVVKSLILQLLSDHEYAKPVHIIKFGDSLTLVPSEAVKPEKMPLLQQVLRILDDTLGNENPTLYQRVEELWRRHLFVLYPFLPKYTDPSLWAAALHKVGYEMHGIEIEMNELHILYEFKERELKEACTMLKDIEEISCL
ncbi:DNA damage checkpoint antagonist DdcA [Bacillus sp. NPDC077027]|uniref:DNA damage checkpoint antagonist DdcA n=1 Tax=Bacillus sp. NPDC077027 TaxID=3390548 RepID=UPI003D075743